MSDQALQITDIAFQYPASDHVLWHCDRLSVDYNSLILIQGPSGIGKSSFLRLLGGFYPDSYTGGGKVSVDGFSLVGSSESRRDRFRAERTAFIFQEHNLLAELTALENVLVHSLFSASLKKTYTRRQLHNHAAHCLERVGLADHSSFRPGRLSVGQRQRVAIASALFKRSRLILADEPTASLDPENRQLVTGLLLEAARENNAALLCVSHDIDRSEGQFNTLIEFEYDQTSKSAQLKRSAL